MAIEDLADSSATRRDIAVARVLDPARSRAETRLQRFLDAALELTCASPGKDFTVQEVVERSGQSLRSFYQYFNSKDDLLLALFEDSVRATAQHLRSELAQCVGARERLHRFVVGYHDACRPRAPARGARPGVAPALADFAHQLLTERPEEAARAFLPLVSLCNELLEEGIEQGCVRSDLPRVAAGVLLQATMFSPFAEVIAGPGDSDGGQQLWDLFSTGLQGPQAT